MSHLLGCTQKPSSWFAVLQVPCQPSGEYMAMVLKVTAAQASPSSNIRLAVLGVRLIVCLSVYDHCTSACWQPWLLLGYEGRPAQMRALSHPAWQVVPRRADTPSEQRLLALHRCLAMGSLATWISGQLCASHLTVGM